MKKPVKTILIVLIVVSFCILVFNVFQSNRRLEKALNKIEKVQTNLDSVLFSLNYSQQKIDTMANELSRYKSYIYEIKGRVEIIDFEKRKGDTRFVSDRKAIARKLDSLYNVLDVNELNFEIEPLN